MVKTLNLQNLYNTPVDVKVKTTLKRLFAPTTSIFIKLTDNSWVLYQLKFKELIKKETLAELLEVTFSIDEDMFSCFAEPCTEAEITVIESIFLLNDNYNLDTSIMYKMT